MKSNRIIYLIDIAYLFIFSVIVMMVANIDVIIRAISQRQEQEYIYFYETVSGVVEDAVYYVSDIAFTPSIVTFIAWGIFGFISYIVLEVIFDSTKNFKDTVSVAASYAHPRNFKQSKYWLSFLIHFLASTAFIVLFVLWFTWLLRIFIPFSSYQLVTALGADISVVEIIINVIQAFISIFTGLLGLLVIARLAIIYKETE